jgi:hypothetical protein
MKVYLLYNRNTPDERLVTDMKERLEEAQVETELLDADSPSGIQFAESHDVMGRPALALVRNDGSPVQIWQGTEALPTVSEVSYQAHQ